ncbi:hypothetical protein AJ79_09751 [Helicocarpus griseus UAMH5409]|uniref:Uncharacterized protein n=1 Tax=Helicocarpus griseus UAMH5409 TaxID=1447875 RepID=A0A2B7W946_9EURO|nr:hypothetical protein AJ79_09751 [Helicocarpus griseus UAMH5409]
MQEQSRREPQQSPAIHSSNGLSSPRGAEAVLLSTGLMGFVSLELAAPPAVLAPPPGLPPVPPLVPQVLQPSADPRIGIPPPLPMPPPV